MSELQLALVGVAAPLLLALFLYSKWQERRLLRRMRERLHGGVDDALLRVDPRAVPRVEPRLPPDAAAGGDVAPAPGGSDDAARTPADAAGGAREAASVGAVSSEALSTPAALLRPNWIEDPLLDCSLEMRFARAVDGVSVIDAVAVLAHASWKQAVNFVVWDGRHQQWVLPDRFGYYTDALVSVQLADRRGRLDEPELLRFVDTVRQVASTLDADVDAPDTARLLAQAQELDRLCARFDIKIGLTVESSGAAWTGPQVRSAAQQAGFLAGQGPVTQGPRWVRYDSQGDPLYTLQAEPSAMTRLTLELDIAVAPVVAEPFRAMVASAQNLAATLGARVVDDNGTALDATSVDAIAAQLAQVYEEMRAAGIEPGSARARRLYV